MGGFQHLKAFELNLSSFPFKVGFVGYVGRNVDARASLR